MQKKFLIKQKMTSWLDPLLQGASPMLLCQQLMKYLSFYFAAREWKDRRTARVKC